MRGKLKAAYMVRDGSGYICGLYSSAIKAARSLPLEVSEERHPAIARAIHHDGLWDDYGHEDATGYNICRIIIC